MSLALVAVIYTGAVGALLSAAVRDTLKKRPTRKQAYVELSTEEYPPEAETKVAPTSIAAMNGLL